MRRLSIISTIALAVAFVLVGTVLSPRSASAVEVEVTAHPVRREILALYDGRAEGPPHATRIHRFAEMPLNWLGYAVVYRDVAEALPSEGELQRYRGLLTWFLEPLANPAELGRWLETTVRKDLRYVVLGDMLPGLPERDVGLLGRLHRHLGLRYTGDHEDVTYRARVRDIDRTMVGFERPVDRVLPAYPVIEPLPGKVTVHLSIASAERDGERSSAVVVTSPAGGYAAEGFTIFFEPSTDRTLWTLNPFQFFRQAFGDHRFPVPDATTLSGRRIYFSHIDGDGWNNASEIERYRESQTLASEVILREVIAPYPDLPVSVALISGDVMPLLGGTPQAARIARQLFALRQVEVASHTHTHPFNWQFFDRYDRAEEERKIEAHARPPRPLLDRLSGALLEVAGRRPAADPFDKYIAGSDALPRTYLRAPFDLDAEVAGSLRIAETLAPPGKRAKLYQWSGDTTPFEAAIRATRRAGVRNMNGGDSRLDRDYPSVSYVPALGRPAGSERQIYAANSNENTYTNDWTGPYFGFFLLEQTLLNTEAPRRLKPFNLYYHMYSGEKEAALAAIRHFVELARRSPVVPVDASEYAAIADSFYQVEIEQVGLFAWAVTRRGALQTVRFDDAEALTIDRASSRGVIGYRRTGGSLYVTLDAAVERAIVALRGRQARDQQAEPRQPPLLSEARWQLSGVEVRDCMLTATARGYGPSEMIWQTEPQRSFRVIAERDGQTVADVVVRADGEGRLPVNLAVDARDGVGLQVACHE